MYGSKWICNGREEGGGIRRKGTRLSKKMERTA